MSKDSAKSRQEYYIKNRTKILEYNNKKYYENWKEELEYAAKYRQKNRKKIIKYLRRWSKENKERKRETDKKYKEKNRDYILTRKREHYWANRKRIQIQKKKHYTNNKERILSANRDNYHKIKTIIRYDVFSHYSKGVPTCNCCGYQGLIFLTIDHIIGRQNEERRLTGIDLWRWIKRNQYPNTFQVLCWNCNCTKGFFGTCCHKTPWQPTNKMRKWKLKLLQAYSQTNPKCACCGESEIGFLTIDHINGRPKEEKGLTASNLYLYLKKKGFPQGYQVLCYNCNSAKGISAKCPHQSKLY